MTRSPRQHGTPVILNSENIGDSQRLTPISLDEPPFAEDGLQALLALHTSILPIHEIEPAYAPIACLGREIITPAGPLDLLYVSEEGHLTIVETKLWKNPQSRREVIGQIIDYAKELTMWNFDDLDRAVQLAQKQQGQQPQNIIELVRSHQTDINEISFRDTVSRELQRGQLLLIIAGNGIRQEVESIVDYIQRTPGLHFSLALIELVAYRFSFGKDWPVLIQPRTIIRTTEVVRAIIDVRIPAGVQVDITLPSEGKSTRSANLTEQAFYEQLTENTNASIANAVRMLCQELKDLKLLEKWNPGSISLRYPTPKKDITVLVIQKNGQFYLGWLNEIAKLGYDSQIAVRYLQGVVKLTGAQLSGNDATKATPILQLLNHHQAFLDLVRQFTDDVFIATQSSEQS